LPEQLHDGPLPSPKADRRLKRQDQMAIAGPDQLGFEMETVAFEVIAALKHGPGAQPTGPRECCPDAAAGVHAGD
jgi:hypothetical protein